MKSARHFVVAALLGAMLAPAAAAPLETLVVAAAKADRTYTAEGVVEAVRQSAIAAQVPARIIEMRVRAGDQVKAGQVLVRLDPRTAADQLATSQANVSKHLSVLAHKGLIEKSLRGTSAFYRIVDPRIYQLCDLVCAQVGQRFAQHAAMKDVFLDAARAAEASTRKRPPRAS